MGHIYETTPDDDVVQDDIKEINELNAATQGSKLTWKEFLSNGKEMNLWRFSAACASQAFQQITVSYPGVASFSKTSLTNGLDLQGINLVTYYATTVFGRL